jgi:hypothetical protein
MIVSDAGQNEQKVGKAIKIDESLPVDRFGGHESDDGAFGPPTDGAGEVKMGCGQRTAWKHETSQRLEIVVQAIDRLFQFGDVLSRDAEMRSRLFAGLRRPAQIAANVEQVVLNAPQELRLRYARRRQRQADACIEFIDLAVGGNARVIFTDAVAIAESRLTGVTRFRVNARKINHAASHPEFEVFGHLRLKAGHRGLPSPNVASSSK